MNTWIRKISMSRRSDEHVVPAEELHLNQRSFFSNYWYWKRRSGKQQTQQFIEEGSDMNLRSLTHRQLDQGHSRFTPNDSKNSTPTENSSTFWQSFQHIFRATYLVTWKRVKEKF
jgi:hypothetical protein